MSRSEDNETRTDAYHAEDEVKRRGRELEAGTVEEISYEELLKRVNGERSGRG
jgi:hypothetical protein